MLKGNALVGQSGGPTAVINGSLVGVIEAAKGSKAIRRVLGMRFGIEGVLGDFLLDLSAEPASTLKGLRTSPSSALGSSRHKLKEPDFEPILKALKKYDIRYLFMIGGNDTMDTIHRITEYAASVGYEMIGVGVPKTVDNDLFGLDHTPGYPSAARYVALSVQQGGLLARDMQRVDPFTVFQTVGRSAGWLAAAASLAKREPGDPPHIILMPERPFEQHKFLAAAENAYKKFGFVSVVCGEGITYADGTPVSASKVTDKFSNVEFGAMGGTSAAMMLHRMLANAFGWRGEFQVTESLQMCAADRAVKLDQDEAYGAGREAVRLAMRGEGGVMVTVERANKRGQKYKAAFGTIPLKKVAINARPMDDKYIGKDGMSVTKAFHDYAAPLVGELPQYASLTIKKAKASYNMNLTDKKYTPFGLVRDMMATADVVANFDANQAKDTAAAIVKIGKLHLTGEGSSRLFPAKHAIMQARRAGWKLALHTDAGRQSQEYDLSDWAVFAASNSGQTSEVIRLFTNLKEKGHAHRYGLTASDGSKLGELSNKCYVLKCGPEGAVAATKSVVEQALFYHAMLEHIAGKVTLATQLQALASHMREALTVPIDPALIDKIAKAGTIYFAGRNDGVAEELTLKTNEITRKKSDYLEGTYAVHGIEEVMNRDDVLIWVDPYEDSEQKFTDVLSKGVGLTIIAISERPTVFPTIRVPKSELSSYVMMAAGWNLLVEVGVKLGIDLDKPVRARKVGNEFVG